MTRTTRLCLAALLASLAAHDSAAFTDEEMATTLSRHGMTIARINSIYTSEVTDDFGKPLSTEESEKLWAINSMWQFQENMKDKVSAIGASNNFASYLGCSNETDTSGNKRRIGLEQLFGPFTDRIYVSDNSVINDFAERSCFLLSAKQNVFWDVLQNNSVELTQYLELQPAGPSMKMLEGFYDSIAKRLNEGGDVTVNTNNGTVVITADEEMAIDVQFCPVIEALIKEQPADNRKKTYNDFLTEVMVFMTETSGKFIKNRDFFYHAVENKEVPSNLVSARMQDWHDVVENITDLTDANGGNKCLNDFIKQKMIVTKSSDSTAQVTFPVIEEIGTKDEECIFFLVRALANHPYVCRMDLVARVGTLDSPSPDSDSAPRAQGAGVAAAVVSGLAGLALTALL